MRRSHRLTLLAVLALVPAVAVAHAQRTDRPRPSVYTLPGEAVYPEGVGREPGGTRFFVSSTTDGTILRGDVRRAGLVPFAPGGTDGRTMSVGVKADGRHVYVAGGGTGKAFVLSARTGRTVKVLDTAPGDTPTFMNDVALAPRYAYFTDSLRPIIFRAATRGRAIGAMRPWLDLKGTPFAYEQGFNANGIESFDGGRLLVVVQYNTGELFRIDTRTRRVTQIDLGGANVKNGDGLAHRGNTLYVVRNVDNNIAVISLRRNLRAGTIRRTISNDAFRFPTTAAVDGRRLLVVNSQFDKREAGTAPELPFTVVAVPRGR